MLYVRASSLSYGPLYYQNTHSLLLSSCIPLFCYPFRMVYGLSKGKTIYDSRHRGIFCDSEMGTCWISFPWNSGRRRTLSTVRIALLLSSSPFFLRCFFALHQKEDLKPLLKQTDITQEFPSDPFCIISTIRRE